ncbi:hypothetical protein, partial [Bacteroides thetaiotaomicron]|uniref:hypothetical protein n=1 Tax=Bacteroides thetaiotaomicron TaxID=818 RepID=UPI001CFFE06F
MPFPLAVLSAALHPANTLPCGTAKGYFCIVQGGRGEPGKAAERTYSTNKKHTPKRHNRLYKINRNCFAIWKQK